MMMYLIGIAYLCQKFVFPRLKAKRTKNIPLFWYYRAHAKTTKNSEKTE